MIYDVRQTTTCGYASPVAHARHVLRLTPVSRDGERVQVAALQIFPEPAHRREGQDFFGNRLPDVGKVPAGHGPDGSGPGAVARLASNHRAVTVGAVSRARNRVAAAATVRCVPGGDPSSSSFQKIPHPPASAFPTTGAVSSRPTAAIALGLPTSAAWPAEVMR